MTPFPPADIDLTWHSSVLLSAILVFFFVTDFRGDHDIVMGTVFFPHHICTGYSETATCWLLEFAPGFCKQCNSKTIKEGSYMVHIRIRAQSVPWEMVFGTNLRFVIGWWESSWFKSWLRPFCVELRCFFHVNQSKDMHVRCMWGKLILEVYRIKYWIHF